MFCRLPVKTMEITRLTGLISVLLYVYIMINMNIKNLVGILFVTLLLTACSVKNPTLSYGKKCLVEEEQVVYSYVWLFNSEEGLKATKEQCKQIAE